MRSLAHTDQRGTEIRKVADAMEEIMIRMDIQAKVMTSGRSGTIDTITTVGASAAGTGRGRRRHKGRDVKEVATGQDRVHQTEIRTPSIISREGGNRRPKSAEKLDLRLRLSQNGAAVKSQTIQPEVLSLTSHEHPPYHPPPPTLSPP